MKNKWWTVIAYLHGRNSDCAADKCKAVHIQAINEEEASELFTEEFEPADPEVLYVFEGKLKIN